MTDWEHNPETTRGKIRENPVIVSELSADDARKSNPDLKLAPEMQEFAEAIRERQEVLPIVYINFNGEYEQGQLTVDKAIAPAIAEIFAELLQRRFPIEGIRPIASYEWDDDRSMEYNNTSAQNIRLVGRSEKLSLHSFGIAIDLNPRQNPMVIGEAAHPSGAAYDASGNTPGTVTKEIVDLFAKYGFDWGGDWKNLKDYQHFQINPETLRNRALRAVEENLHNEATAQELAYWQKIIDLQTQKKVSA